MLDSGFAFACCWPAQEFLGSFGRRQLCEVLSGFDSECVNKLGEELRFYVSGLICAALPMNKIRISLFVYRTLESVASRSRLVPFCSEPFWRSLVAGVRSRANTHGAVCGFRLCFRLGSIYDGLTSFVERSCSQLTSGNPWKRFGFLVNL